MLVPLESGAWLDHDAGWLSRDAADEALAALRDKLVWEHAGVRKGLRRAESSLEQ